jgi:hypothetical protein
MREIRLVTFSPYRLTMLRAVYLISYYLNGETPHSTHLDPKARTRRLPLLS